MRSIEGYIRENSPVTARQVADGVDVPEDDISDSVSKKHVLEVFGRLEDQGVVVIRKGEGAYGADLCEYIEGQLGRVVDLDGR
jgi:DNA-binding FadR family transcriptional regulator